MKKPKALPPSLSIQEIEVCRRKQEMETRIYPMNILSAENELTKIVLFLQQAIDGFRFCPTEEELLNYLKLTVSGCRESFCIIPTLENIYEINPWDLPAKFSEKSVIPSKDQEWWFICPQTQNQRISRKTPCGFSWKITGKHIDIKAKNDDKKIGSKITLVFIDGRNSKGTRSNWVLHEFHPHPDDTGFVIYCLKMKQYEKADTHAAVATNGDFSSTPQFQNHEVSFSELNEVIGKLSDEVYGQSDGSYQNRTKSLALIQEDNHYSSPNQERLEGTKDPSSTENSSGRGLAVPDPTNDELNFPHPFPNVDFCSANEAEKETINQLVAELFRSMEEEVDEMSGEQADKSCDSMDCDNPEQLPSAEHRVQEIQNQLRRLITNESSSSTEISSGSCHTGSSEWSRIRPRMPPLGHALFPNGDLFRLNDLSSETEADRVIQYCQLGETSRDNCRAEKNQRPVCDTLEGAVPGEEKGFAEEKLNHPHDMEKIITECTSSDGVPAKGKAQAGEFKEKETTMIRPQEKNFEMKIESDNMFHGESWTESLSPTRSIPSTSCSCRNRSTIDPAVYFARLMALVLVVGLIVDGICRKSDGISEIKKVYVFYGRI